MTNKTKKVINDKSSLWRFGYIETWSPVFNGFIRQNEQTTIKPNISIKHIESELTKEYKTQVRLYLPDSMF